MKLLSLAFLLALVPAQDKITLKFNPKKGDKLSRTEKTEMTIKAKVVAGDQTQDLEIEQRESQKSSLEFVEVAEGAVTKGVFICQEQVEEKKGPPAQQWEKSQKPLHGRTVTMSLKDGKLVRDGADGIEEKVLNKLDLVDRSSRIFPKTPVGPGDSWDVKGDDVRQFLSADDDLKDGKIKVKFLSVKEIDGKRCAVLNGDFELVGKVEGDIDITIKLEAEVVVWIERGYTLSVKGKGTFTMKGENAQFKLTGQGPMTMEITTSVQ